MARFVKKCAMKIVNCFKSHSDIVKAFSKTYEECKSARTPEAKAIKRGMSTRTPTGITPMSKRLKPKEAAEETRPSSKKKLFSCDDSNKEYSNLDDHISSLMNLPVVEDSSNDRKTTPPIVKVSLCPSQIHPSFLREILIESYPSLCKKYAEKVQHVLQYFVFVSG